MLSGISDHIILMRLSAFNASLLSGLLNNDVSLEDLNASAIRTLILSTLEPVEAFQVHAMELAR